MAVNIKKLSREPVLSNNFLNVIKTVQVDITDTESKELAAQLVMSYQVVYSEKEIKGKETDTLINKTLEPVFFTQFNSLLGDIRFPSLNYDLFSDMYGKTPWDNFPGVKPS